MAPKVLLLVLLLLTAVGESGLWVQILVLTAVVVGCSFGPSYRWVLARREPIRISLEGQG